VIVYISIGNSDDKLTQAEWARFFSATSKAIRGTHFRGDPQIRQVHGQWASEPASAWQNACWCVEMNEAGAEELRWLLKRMAKMFRQDSIAWSETTGTEFLEASDD
jgi:hypothetical protein